MFGLTLPTMCQIGTAVLREHEHQLSFGNDNGNDNDKATDKDKNKMLNPISRAFSLVFH